jgi:hypothetical protein
VLLVLAAQVAAAPVAALVAATELLEPQILAEVAVVLVALLVGMGLGQVALEWLFFLSPLRVTQVLQQARPQLQRLVIIPS